MTTRSHRFLALLLALAMALGLTACSKDALREKASDIIIDLAVALGFRDADSSEEEEVTIIEATPGGSVIFPEDFDYIGQSMATLLRDGTLFISFRGIQYKSTDYFVATGPSVTITAYATSTNSDAKNPPAYKAALWELADDMATTAYLEGSTVYYSAAGEGSCYTYTVSGLTPGRHYKVSISYDTGAYYLTGGMAVSGVSDEELLSIEGEEG